MLSFLDELKQKNFDKYIFREQTLIWKDDDGEYKYYISVVLGTCKKMWFPRFDHSAFNYGIISKNLDTICSGYICDMDFLHKQIGNTNQYNVYTHITEPKISHFIGELMWIF